MKYELNIYGKDDEIVKRYGSNVCPWGVFIRAASMQDELADKPAIEQMQVVGDILKCVFPELTQEELEHADSGDVMNVFAQLVNGGQKVAKGSAKNA